jgi:hypothetical protein
MESGWSRFAGERGGGGDRVGEQGYEGKVLYRPSCQVSRASHRALARAEALTQSYRQLEFARNHRVQTSSSFRIT